VTGRAHNRANRILARLAAGLLGLFVAGPALAQSPGAMSAVPLGGDCDHACLISFVESYIDGLAHRDPSRVAFAKDVRFTENDVELPIGNDGLWATATGVSKDALEVADPETGNAAWFGIVQEHGKPAYLAMRIKVLDRHITEVETVVNRLPDLPKPFGDVTKLKHDPSFNEILPPEERRSRQRLVAVTNGYFSTVERNDGQVLTEFDKDCARTENGMMTTRGGGGAAAISQGCEAQFKLGIYRINKRVRERRYPIVDTERGVVVASGFFDHANTFDHYKLTDGREMKTVLKWPNSITLLEAFKIKSGKIYQIEAVFTYVPYFMHSPFAGPAAVPPQAAAPGLANQAPPSCDRACLIGFADKYMAGLVKQDYKKIPWAKKVGFSENEVPMMIGDGLWGAINGKSAKPIYAADPETGNVAWIGTVDEHGQPAFYGMRLRVSGDKIAEVQSFVARKGNPGPYGDPTKFVADPVFDQVLPEDQRRPRQRMVALVDGYFSSKQQNDGQILTELDPDCQRIANGEATTSGDDWAAKLAQGCEAQFKLGVYRPVDHIRDRSYPVVDEERGVVVSVAFIDHAARDAKYDTTDGKSHDIQIGYPNSRGEIEIFKIRNGKIYRIQAVSVFLPYDMPTAWEH